VRALLLDAGFHEPATEVLGWSDRPTLTQFVDRHASLGVTGRRLALLDTTTQSAFLMDVRRRLEPLALDDFRDTSDVILATATATATASAP
jgi:hypothetical protein